MSLTLLKITNHTEFNVPLVNTTDFDLGANTLSRAALITVEMDPNPGNWPGSPGGETTWMVENQPSYGTGPWTICHQNLKISGYSGSEQTIDSNETSSNPLFGTKYYNGPGANSTDHPYSINAEWSPYVVYGDHKIFIPESTFMNGDQASVGFYNQSLACDPEINYPGCLQGGIWNPNNPNWSIEGGLAAPGEDAVSLWDSRVKHILMFNSLGVWEVDFAGEGTMYPEAANGWYGDPGNKVYVIVVFNNDVSITEDTSTVIVNIDGMPRYHLDS